jgi:hypothetical protein
MKTFHSGDKVKLTLEFEAELVCDSDEPIKEELLTDMVLSSKGFCDSQIVVGKLFSDTKDDHDTELLLNSLSVKIARVK